MEGEVVAEMEDGGPGGEDEGCVDLEIAVSLGFLFCFFPWRRKGGRWYLQHEDPSRGY